MHSRKAALITVIFGINALISIATQIVIARNFGLSTDLDSFLIAVTVPTIIVTILYSAINDSFMGNYATAVQNGTGREEAGKWFKALLRASIIAAGILFLIAPLLVRYGFNYQQEAAVSYLQVMLITLPLSVCAGLLMSISYFEGKYIAPPLSQLMGVLVNLAVIYFFSEGGAWALAAGFIASIATQFVLMSGYLSRINFSVTLADTAPLLRQVGVVMGAAFLLRTDQWMLRAFAPPGEGMVSAVNFASRFFSLGAGIITSGIAVILTPLLSRAWAQKDHMRFELVRRKALIGMFVLSLGVTVLLVVFRDPLVQGLLVHGSFTARDAAVVTNYMVLFAPAGILWGLINGLFVPYVIRNKQKQGAGLIFAGVVLGVVSGIALWFGAQLYAAPVAVTTMLASSCVLLALFHKSNE